MKIDPAGKRVTVMGLGRFGGGVGVTRWLARNGARALVTDLQPPECLGDSLAQLSDCVDDGSVQLRLGEHRQDDFTTCDLVVANPAVPAPWKNTYLEAARDAGVPITTEVRLLVERLNRDRVIGITGTAGKSTTTAMIHHILTAAGTAAHLGGNIGGSLLNQLDEIQPGDWIVLELSSAMLYWLGADVGFNGAVGWSPHIALLTNIEENHLDWHESFSHYQQCKHNIFKYQQLGDHPLRGDGLDSATGLIPLQIPGAHNQRNAQMAIAVVCAATSIDATQASGALGDFIGLPHRLQLVSQRDGLQFYNDSKSTTPNATVLAVESFDEASRIHLIAGGYDKGLDLSSITDLASKLGGFYTIGAAGRALVETAAARASSCEFCETLDTAVDRALSRMKRGDILLLSPGCASWDQFDNYENRGEAFVELVTKHVHVQASQA